MKKSISFKAFFSFALAVWGIQATSLVYAQAASSAEDCSQAQAEFVAAMGLFRSAFFEREDAVGSAELVMEEKVLPSAENMYQLCPAETAAAVRAGVERAKATLNDPARAQLVQCDKALITYKGLLSKFDNTSLSSYEAYRALINRDINPSAQAAVEACPQMPELAEQTRLEVIELQSRLDKMQDLDNSGPSYWDTRDNMEERNAAYDEAYE